MCAPLTCASRDPGCDNLGHEESLMGYVQVTPSSDVPRALRLCQYSSSPGVYYHSLESACLAGDSQIDVFGYVH